MPTLKTFIYLCLTSLPLAFLALAADYYFPLFTLSGYLVYLVFSLAAGCLLALRSTKRKHLDLFSTSLLSLFVSLALAHFFLIDGNEYFKPFSATTLIILVTFLMTSLQLVVASMVQKHLAKSKRV